MSSQFDRIFYPKILTTWKGYNFKQFWTDIMAGMIVGVVAIPLSIAFGIASGVTPESGIITAIIAGFIISALGGSRVQIGGPTGAYVVIVFDIIQKHGLAGLTIATFIAGIFLIILGLAKIGTWIRYIPLPVVIGFTSGIAVSIFSSQIPDLLGLCLAKLPGHFTDKMAICYAHMHETNLIAVAIASLCILFIVCTPKFIPRLPGSFLALFVTSFITYYFSLPVETVGSRFGSVHIALSWPELPSITLDAFQTLLSPAISIALLGGIESLLSAVVADGMIGGRHRPNTELIAQGLANMASPLFGGIPATGAIARTATNIRNGGRTPIAGIVHAVTILLIGLWVGPLITKVPMAALAGILVVVAYNMSEWREFRAILKGPKTEILVLLTTFFITVFVDLVVAVQLGLALSFFLFIKKMSEVSEIKTFQQELRTKGDPDAYYYADELRSVDVPNHVEVYSLSGAFFFGAAGKFEDRFLESLGVKQIIILRMKQVLILDSTGLKMILKLVQRAKQMKTSVYFTELNAELLSIMEQAGAVEEIGKECIFPDLKTAIQHASQGPCIFPEFLPQSR